MVSRLQRVGSFEDRGGGWGAPAPRNKGISALIFTLDRGSFMNNVFIGYIGLHITTILYLCVDKTHKIESTNIKMVDQLYVQSPICH